METADEEFLAAAKVFIEKQHEAGTPFFVWFNTTHMHFRTHAKHWDWYFDHVYLLVPMQGFVGQFLETFKEYPPRQKAASFTIDQVMDHLTSAAHGAG